MEFMNEGSAAHFGIRLGLGREHRVDRGGPQRPVPELSAVSQKFRAMNSLQEQGLASWIASRVRHGNLARTAPWLSSNIEISLLFPIISLRFAHLVHRKL